MQDKKPNCWYHPGKYDFGRKESKDETGTWKPHWTCCIMPWAAKGCTQAYHCGPLKSDYEENPPKNGKWPDVKAMRNFKKEGSKLWRDKFESFKVDDEELSYIFLKFSEHENFIDPSRLEELTETLKLKLLTMSEDLSYHFKYLDVVDGRA